MSPDAEAERPPVPARVDGFDPTRLPALLVCCIIAEQFPPLALSDRAIPEQQIRHTVRRLLQEMSPRYILGWRGRCAVHHVRWDNARATTAALYGRRLTGAETLPDVFGFADLVIHDDPAAKPVPKREG